MLLQCVVQETGRRAQSIPYRQCAVLDLAALTQWIIQGYLCGESRPLMHWIRLHHGADDWFQWREVDMHNMHRVYMPWQWHWLIIQMCDAMMYKGGSGLAL